MDKYYTFVGSQHRIKLLLTNIDQNDVYWFKAVGGLNAYSIEWYNRNKKNPPSTSWGRPDGKTVIPFKDNGYILPSRVLNKPDR